MRKPCRSRQRRIRRRYQFRQNESRAQKKTRELFARRWKKKLEPRPAMNGMPSPGNGKTPKSFTRASNLSRLTSRKKKPPGEIKNFVRRNKKPRSKQAKV